MLNKLKNLAKAALAIAWIRAMYEFANRVVLETFGSSRILTHLLYFFSFLTFNREQAAVLRGRRDYYRNKGDDRRRSHVELRRNVHRLEKGLGMSPRRPVFAKDYIGETIEFFERANAQELSRPGTIDQAEIAWANDVLTAYFDACAHGDPLVDAARARFGKLTVASSGTHAPAPRREAPPLTVEYDELLTLANRRRSVRWFEQRPVDRDLIDKALLVARQAPTACNRLPYEYRIFDDPAMARDVASIPFGSAGYSHNIPAVAVVVGKLEAYFSPRDRHAIYIDASLSAMSFMLALETLGLSSSVINWPDFEPLEAKMQKKLGLKVSDRVVMLIAFGHADPDGSVPHSAKKELDTLRTYNLLR